MGVYNVKQFLVHNLLCRRGNSKKEHTGLVALGKDEAPRIAIPRQEKSVSRTCFPQDRAVRRLSQIEIHRRHDIVPLRHQDLTGRSPCVVVGQKRHEEGADT